jgi:hypothetical protein
MHNWEDDVVSICRALCFLAMAFALPFPGCGGSPAPSRPQYAVRGKVLYRGQPATQAIVVLHPMNQAEPPRFPPRGVAGKDGAFVIGSRLVSDGAPEGEYAVTIIWPEEQGPKTPIGDTPPDRLKNHYNNLKHAKWRVHVAAASDNGLETFNIE